MSIKPVLFVPILPSMPGEAFWHFMAIAHSGVPFMRQSYGRTDFVRNKAVETLLESEFTHILMLDADHLHPPDILPRLARWVIADNSIQVVGGLNFKRSEPFDPCCFVKAPNGNGPGYAQPHQWEPGLLKVDLIGTGCILISREVFEAIKPPWFYYPYDGADGGHYPTEDIGFSRNCQAAGVELWVDTTTTSPHLMTTTITEQTYRTYCQAHPELEAEVVDVGL